MDKHPDENRVRLCLACDRMIAFSDQICPYCQASQPLPGELPLPGKQEKRHCPNCSEAIPRMAVFCPRCDALTISTASAPVPETAGIAGRETAPKNSLAVIGFLFALALLIQAGLIIDFLFLV